MNDRRESEAEYLVRYLSDAGIASLAKVFEQIRSMTGYGEIRIEIRNNAVYRISVTQSIKPAVDLSSKNDV